jgi:hypothetical protein
MKKYFKITASVVTLILTGVVCYATIPTPKKTQKVNKSNYKTIEPSKKNIVQIALLLDTSNSMDGLINQAKTQLWDIVNEFSYAKCGNNTKPELQIALYQYGNDRLSPREGYIQQILNFSGDLDEISEKLFSLTTNGGEEYCGEVMDTSLDQLEWGTDPDQLKLIFIAGNEPFDQGRTNYVNAALKAKEKGVVINTIFCGNHDLGAKTHWKKGATLTGGTYMAIDHNETVAHIHTPYDKIIIELNSKLNDTYISYGPQGHEKHEMQAIQDDNALEMEEAVAVKRAVSKSSRLYNNKKWDLVDATSSIGYSKTNISMDDLPVELREKSDTEIEAFLKEKRVARKKIQKEIQALNQKREAYIAQKTTADDEGGLESAIIKAIKQQAATKDYHWE